MNIKEEYLKLEATYIAFGKIFNNYESLLRRLGFSDLQITWKLTNLDNLGKLDFVTDDIKSFIANREFLLECYAKNNPMYTNSLTKEDITKRTWELECEIAELELHQDGYMLKDYESTLAYLYKTFKTNYDFLLKRALGLGFYNLLKDTLKPINNYQNWEELLKTLDVSINIYLDCEDERAHLEEIIGLLEYQNNVLTLELNPKVNN